MGETSPESDFPLLDESRFLPYLDKNYPVKPFEEYMQYLQTGTRIE